MANRTDPLAAALSGSDPQNLLEYITRQKIYDSRFWKEECFGLTLADVLEKAVKQLECMGGLPTKFLSLTLKLLQLHPETELVVETFIEQEDFKYVRALGCLYVRLTGRPVDVYDALEPLYRDRRKLRVWNTATQIWSLQHMDEYIHQLLTQPDVLGMALPRLPSRQVLQEAGYLPEGPRPTALKDVLAAHGNDPLAYFEYKVNVEQSPAAIEAWNRRLVRLGKQVPNNSKASSGVEKSKEAGSDAGSDKDREEKREKRPKKKQRNYDGLFKKDKKSPSKVSSSAPVSDNAAEEHSDAYWDAERARLGLKPLKK